MIAAPVAPSPNQMLKVSLLSQAILGWVCTLFFAFLAVMALLSNETGPAFFFLFFIALGVYLILTTGNIRMNQHVVTYETPLGRYQIGWDEISEIRTNYSRRSFLLVGAGQAGQKQFVLPGTAAWFGKDKKAMLALFAGQIQARGIPIKNNVLMGFSTRKNVRVSWDSPDPETYLARPPQTAAPQEAVDYSKPLSQQAAFQSTSSLAPGLTASVPMGPRLPAQPANPINLTIGAAAGFVVAILAAVLWAAITYFAEFQIGWMAIGVGVAIGYTVRVLSKGGGFLPGMLSASLALFGCVLGNFLTVVAVVAVHESVSMPNVLLGFLLNPDVIIKAMVATFQPLDLLFYGFAVYYGFRVSAR
jgi:hypothetical protein